MFVAPKHRAKQMDAAGEWMMIKQRASGSPPTGDRVYLLYYRGRDADHCAENRIQKTPLPRRLPNSESGTTHAPRKKQQQC